MQKNNNKTPGTLKTLTPTLLLSCVLGSTQATAADIDLYASFDAHTGILSIPCISYQGEAFSGQMELAYREGYGEYVRPIAAEVITGNVPEGLSCVDTVQALGTDAVRADYNNLPLLQNGVDTGERYELNTLVDPADPFLDFRILSVYPAECEIGTPPAHLGLDPFYEKYCDANGLPVISSALVPDEALRVVRRQVLDMTRGRPDVLSSMVASRGRIAIMAESQVTTDIPEHSDLYEVFPGTDWDTRARGLGATMSRPVSSAAEENILCYASDSYYNADINIHEFAHSMDLIGLRQTDATWEFRLQASYDAALAAGLWEDTYAGSNKEEYFAEGVVSWFNRNADPHPGVHNHVNTRAELADYDPQLHALIAEVMPEYLMPGCHPDR